MANRTDKFHADPVLFATKRPLIIEDAALRQPTAAGTLRTFPTAVTYFDVVISTMFPSAASVRFYQNPGAHRLSCYLLPYAPGADVEIVIDNNAQYFFTSNLSGCGVQVQNDVNGGLRVIHANARNIFDTSGAAAARAAIDARLQNYRPNHGNVTRVTKAVQENAFNQATGNMQALRAMAKPTLRHARIANIQIDNNAAALTGAFFGVNTNAGWQFYSQVSSGMTGTQTKFFGLGKTVNIGNYGMAVMGRPHQVWPDATGAYTV